jgi:hypothetical protein
MKGLSLSLLLFFLFLISCSTTNVVDYRCNDDNFDLEIKNTNLSDTEKKQLLSEIINYSGIKYNKDSDKILIIFPHVNTSSSVLSNTNISSVENIIMNSPYKIIDKQNNNTIHEGTIKIIETLNNLSSNRFIAYNEKNVANKTLIYNLTKQLKMRIDLFLKKNNCG